jgi:hypothetical protein
MLARNFEPMVDCPLQRRKLDHVFLIIVQRSHELLLVRARWTSTLMEERQLVVSLVYLSGVADIDLQELPYRTVDIHLPQIRECRWIDPIEIAYNEK